MSMLSGRGNRNVDELGVPWRFARRTTYDSETNPEGMISFATAEQLLMGKELEELANKVSHLSSFSPFHNFWLAM